MGKLEEIADPELISRIVDWFGEPASPASPPRDDTDPEVAEYYARVARACDAVSPEMLAYAERHRDAPLLAEPETPRLAISEDMPRYSPEGAPRVGVAEPGHYQQPDWIRRALEEENTPQAVLRDLHRPVADFSSVLMERTEFHSDITGQARGQALRDLIAQRFQTDISQFVLGSASAQAGLSELRQILNARWEDSLPEKPMPKPSIRGPSFDNALWFGD